MTYAFSTYTNIIHDQDSRKQYKMFLKETYTEKDIENICISMSECKIKIHHREALEWKPNSSKFIIVFDLVDLCDCEIDSISVTDSTAKDIVLFISKFVTDNKILSVLKFNTIDAKAYQIQLQKAFPNSNRYKFSIINQDNVILTAIDIWVSNLSILVEAILASIYYSESMDE